MAVENSSLGLKYIGISDVSPNPFDATYTELEDAQIDSASVTESEATTENIFIEQRSTVYRNITTQEGSTVFTVNLYDVSVDTLSRLKGGVVTAPSAGAGKRWSKKGASFEVTKALKLITLDNFILWIPNGKVVANIAFTLAKTALATVSLTITAQDHVEGDVIWEEPSEGGEPANTVAPAITGTTEVGETLTVSDGTWTGTPTPSVTRQWQRGTSGSFANISGATGSTYVLQNADLGNNIRVVETATNTEGTTTANSNTVGPITE